MTDDTLPPDRFAKLAAWHFRVIPVHHRHKKPALSWGKYMTEAPSPDEIARWDRADFNVGIVTGLPDSVVVLDVDNDEAQQFVDGLGLPITPTVRTGRGHHYYFKTPAREIRNTVRLADQKLDVRGSGGFVVAPGSIHANGSRYEWEISPSDVDLAPFPEQILALIDAQLKAKPKRAASEITSAAFATDDAEASQASSGIDKFLQQELDEAASTITGSTEGERNNVLFKMAVRLARHVAAAKSGWEPFAAALAESARSIGLEEDEIVRTIESGWTRGSAEPTPWVRVAVAHVYLAAQERFYHIPSGTDLRPAGFNGQYGHCYFGDGSFANFLLKMNYIRKVTDLAYEPLEQDLCVARDGVEYLNTFRPSKVIAREGDANPFENFMAGLVPDPDERAHIVKMMAFTVRYPGHKLRYALMLRTEEHGVGKSMFASIWGEMLGPQNVRKTTPKEIFSDYQGYLPQNLLVLCEEMNLGMGLKTYNDVKDMITADIVTVNEKHLRQRQWRNYSTFVFFSNLPQPILLEASDRRFFYVDCKSLKRSKEYYAEFANWWSGNLGVIKWYLDQVDLDGFSPHQAPPMTEAKLALIAGSKSELAKDLALAVSERQGCFDRDLVTLNAVQLELERKWSKSKIIDALKEVGAEHLGQQRVGDAGRASLWAIRNCGYWRHADPNMRAAELSYHGGGIFSALDGIEVTHLSNFPAVK